MKHLITLTWREVYKRLEECIPKKGKVYGIPRGGSIVAAMTGRAVNTPEEADFIVDDIIDSGTTKKEWAIKSDKPLYVLVDKQKEGILGWVKFPWEVADDVDNFLVVPSWYEADHLREAVMSYDTIEEAMEEAEGWSGPLYEEVRIYRAKRICK